MRSEPRRSLKGLSSSHSATAHTICFPPLPTMHCVSRCICALTLKCTSAAQHHTFTITGDRNPVGNWHECSDIITVACYTLNTVNHAEPARKPLPLYYGSRDKGLFDYTSFTSHVFLLKLMRRNGRKLSHIFGIFLQSRHPSNCIATIQNILSTT